MDIYTLDPKDPFERRLIKMAETHKAKDHDYSGNEIRYQNFRGCTDMGVQPWKSVLIRMMDKVNRLKNFAKKGVLKAESASDAWLDIAVYAIIGDILMAEEDCPKGQYTECEYFAQIVREKPSP